MRFDDPVRVAPFLGFSAPRSSCPIRQMVWRLLERSTLGKSYGSMFEPRMITEDYIMHLSR